MKIERIDENEIKVILTINDLEERNLDFNSLNYNSPAAQELFWDMMEQAEIEFGFTAFDSQLSIEAIPDYNTGFVITITKLDDEESFESLHNHIKHRYKKNDSKSNKKIKKAPSNSLIYVFENFDYVCTACKKLVRIYNKNVSIYEYKNNYYLMITKNNLDPQKKIRFDLFLSEYGNKVSMPGYFEGILNEYGTAILFRKPIESIIKYF